MGSRPFDFAESFNAKTLAIEARSREAPTSWRRVGYLNFWVPQPPFSRLVLQRELLIFNQIQQFELASIPRSPYRLQLELMRWIDVPIAFKIWQFPQTSNPDYQRLTESATLQANQNYLVASLSLAVLTLPQNSEVGDRIVIQGVGPSLWKLQQGDNQQIFAGDDATSIGQSGLIEASSPRDCLELVCVAQNQQWSVTNSYGNFLMA